MPRAVSRMALRDNPDGPCKRPSRQPYDACGCPECMAARNAQNRSRPGYLAKRANAKTLTGKPRKPQPPSDSKYIDEIQVDNLVAGAAGGGTRQERRAAAEILLRKGRMTHQQIADQIGMHVRSVERYAIALRSAESG